MNVEQRNRRSIKSLCSLLGYSRQAYYQSRKIVEKEALQNELLIQQVLCIRSRQHRIGGRKLFFMLKAFIEAHKIRMGRDVFFELLAAHKLLIRKRRRKIPRTTFSNHWLRKYPNLITELNVVSPNQLWVSDITYIHLDDGVAYLALVTDAYSRMIVGYNLNKDLTAMGCVKALQMAIEKLPEDAVLIHHSDRGVQYCCYEYVCQLNQRGISISMTQTSDPRDNAIAERVNGILKTEFLRTSYPIFTSALEAIKASVEIYNGERPHSSINMLTPMQAHVMTGTIERRWKNYYPKKEKEVLME